MNVKFSIEKVFEGIGVATDPFRNSLLRKKKFMIDFIKWQYNLFQRQSTNRHKTLVTNFW